MLRTIFTAGAVLTSLSLASAGCVQDVGGNSYCELTNTITYTNMTQSGTYSRVTNCVPCAQEPFTYGGSQSVFGEELSIILRGPMRIKQIAVYYPNGANSKAKHRRTLHDRRHGHNHARFHEHANQVRAAQEAAQGAEEKRAVGDMVTAVIDGQVETWVNTYAGPTAAPAPVPAMAAAAAVDIANSGSAASSVNQQTEEPYTPSGNSDWIQTAYYNAENGTQKGLVFLNHQLWDATLSFATSDGIGQTSTSQVLGDVYIPDPYEITVMSDKPCNGDCGASWPGSVTQHGFGGEEKIFMFEFQMPLSGKTTVNPALPMDRSAIWLLNAMISREGQYSGCSCWPQCGEFDIWEILEDGYDKTSSQIHATTGQNPGSNSYFNRPTESTMKGAVIFNNGQAVIKGLSPDFVFSNGLSNSDISTMAPTVAKGLWGTTQNIPVVGA